MELYEAMRHTPSCRYFTDEPVDPAVVHRILDNARFASSGGNRQGWRVVVVTDPDLRRSIAGLHRRQWTTYVAHAREGVVGYQGDGSGRLMEHGTDYATRRLDRTDDFSTALADVPVLLVVYVDLSTLAITDAGLDRPSVVGGGSVYTFVQNVLLGCTAEGLGCALTTLLAAEQPAVDDLLGVDGEATMALAALVAVGWPVPDKQYRRLSRNPVESFAFADRWGEPFSPTPGAGGA
ncbi:MAG: nitroreductase family protein [Acidimicrobiales bacterium]